MSSTAEAAMSCGTTARNCAGRLRPQFHRRPSAALSGRAPESATAAGDAYLRIVAHMHPFERAPHPATGRPADGPRARPRRPWRSGDPPARSCLRKRGRSDVRITRPVQRQSGRDAGRDCRNSIKAAVAQPWRSASRAIRSAVMHVRWRRFGSRQPQCRTRRPPSSQPCLP